MLLVLVFFLLTRLNFFSWHCSKQKLRTNSRMLRRYVQYGQASQHVSTRQGLSSGVAYLAIYLGGVRTMRMWYGLIESNSSGGDLCMCISSATTLWCDVM